MPLIDMPLEKLHQYEGRNPRPDDVDEFWDDALAEMHALDPQVELVPHQIDAPFAECFHLYFTGTGGARVHAKYLRPKNADKPHPALLQFHGYSGSSGDWHDKLGWVGRGFSVASLDCRGQGGLSNDAGGTSGNTLRGHIIRGLQDALDGEPHKFYFRHVFLDTALLARIVKSFDEVDENRIGATGGSQGGALTLACAALAPEVKRAAPIFPFLCDYLGSVGLGMLTLGAAKNWKMPTTPANTNTPSTKGQTRGFEREEFMAPLFHNASQIVTNRP